MEQLVCVCVGGGGLPTQKAGNIVSCGMRDDIPCGYEVLNRDTTLSWQLKNNQTELDTHIRTVYE